MTEEGQTEEGQTEEGQTKEGPDLHTEWTCPSVPSRVCPFSVSVPSRSPASALRSGEARSRGCFVNLVKSDGFSVFRGGERGRAAKTEEGTGCGSSRGRRLPSKATRR